MKTVATGHWTGEHPGRRGEAVIDGFINTVLLTLLVIITITIVRMRNLFGVIVLAGVYSFLMASVLIVYDAVDVAMTEAAVGAGCLDRALSRGAAPDEIHGVSASRAPPRSRSSSPGSSAPR